ncbi:WD-40 repeat protein [Hyella patelloides LEGE 07179]|uniref:WD-40 repeat protein n=1 Tax=Hyella patelloides LEGE 07179 TaxID=945734 RepID=A0A563VTP8_9CYAN|nr:WD40 repeat domain-containing protein [Hyella patelloides]VEP14764.1 WD-40 repeat protein [Hyella patelloides LEGE 07179]
MQLLGKKVRKFQVAIVSAIAATLYGINGIPVESQELPSSPEVNIETEPAESESVTPPEVILEKEPALSSWRRPRLIHILPKHQSSIDSLLFSPDNSILISGGGSNDAYMRFWSVDTGEHLTKIRAQNTGILTMAIDPKTEILVSGGEDSVINLWDWQSGEYQATLFQHRGSVTSLKIAPDGKTLVSGAADGIKVWDLTTLPYTPLYTLADFGDPTNEIAINPNGYLVASGDDDGKVKFWNLREATFVSEFAPHKMRISGLAFIQEGKVLVTASFDRTIKLWDLESGQLLQELTGHTGKIRAIAIHPNGNVLATGGNDGIILWNLEQGEIITRLKENSSWIQSLAFSPNGQYLASGGFDLNVRIWEDTWFKSQN